MRLVFDGLRELARLVPGFFTGLVPGFFTGLVPGFFTGLGVGLIARRGVRTFGIDLGVGDGAAREARAREQAQEDGRGRAHVLW